MGFLYTWLYNKKMKIIYCFCNYYCSLLSRSLLLMAWFKFIFKSLAKYKPLTMILYDAAIQKNPILENKSTVLLLPILCHTQGTPPEIWHGVDWTRCGHIGKTRRIAFFSWHKNIFLKFIDFLKEIFFLRFSIFSTFSWWIWTFFCCVFLGIFFFNFEIIFSSSFFG